MKTKAQSTTEYAVLIACCVAALVAMQFYIKRGIQGRLRQAGDEIGEHYAPMNTAGTMTTTLTSDMEITQKLVTLKKDDGTDLTDNSGLPVKGLESTVDIKDETTAKSGTESLGRFEDELF